MILRIEDNVTTSGNSCWKNFQTSVKELINCTTVEFQRASAKRAATSVIDFGKLNVSQGRVKTNDRAAEKNNEGHARAM